MTTKVAFVEEGASYQDVVELLEVWQVNALPVVDAEHRVVGIVSEADLLPKVELEGGAVRPPLPERMRHPGTPVKAAAVLARDVMTQPAVTILPDAGIVAAARLLERRHLKTLPVVDPAGTLVGVICRRDVLRVFLRSDEEIHREIEEDVLGALLRVGPPQVVVSVEHGVVTLDGQLDTRSTVPIAVRLVRGVDGVIDVVDRLTFAIDDVRPGATEEPRNAPAELRSVPGTSGPYGWWHDPTGPR